MAEMDTGGSFGYFYGMQSEMFAFYRIPKILITHKRFKKLSNDSKILYGMMLNRMSLSIKNQWFDEQNRVYIVYTVEEVMEYLNCSRPKAVKCLAELDSEKGIGLTEKRRLGRGKANMIYVKDFMNFIPSERDSTEPDKPVCSPKKKSNNRSKNKSGKASTASRSVKTENVLAENETVKEGRSLPDEVKETSETSKRTEMTVSEAAVPETTETSVVEDGKVKTETQEVTSGEVKRPVKKAEKVESYRETRDKYAQPAGNWYADERDRHGDNHDEKNRVRKNLAGEKQTEKTQAKRKQKNKNSMDARKERQMFMDNVKERISYDVLSKEHPKEQVDEFVDMIVDVLCSKQSTIRVNGENMPIAVVKGRFIRIDYMHMKYIFHSLANNASEIRNIRQYMLTTLYNAPATMQNYYDAEFRKNNADFCS